VNLLTLNTLSNENIGTKEEVNDLLLQLVYGIKKFLSYKEYKDSRFYTEEVDILNFEIIKEYKFKEALLSLKRELLHPFYLFMDTKCDGDCLNTMADQEMENILASDLYFDDEAFDGQKYIILSYSLEKKTFLLSFGKDRWVNYKIIANKTEEDGKSEKVILNNIANKEHVLQHYNEQTLGALPKNNIVYSDEFNDWFLSKDVPIIEKIITKIDKCNSMKFESDGFLLKKLQDDVWEIRIGTEGGLQESAIRVLYKYDEASCIYILWYVVKHGEKSYDYTSDIKKANDIFKKMKKNEL